MSKTPLENYSQMLQEKFEEQKRIDELRLAEFKARLHDAIASLEHKSGEELAELDLKTQIEVMQQARELAIEKFRENGELALDESIDFAGVTDKGIPFEAWLVRPE